MEPDYRPQLSYLLIVCVSDLNLLANIELMNFHTVDQIPRSGPISQSIPGGGTTPIAGVYGGLSLIPFYRLFLFSAPR